MGPPEADEAGRWIAYAHQNIIAAEAVLDRELHRLVCFNAQQAAEMAIKAALELEQVEYPFSHDLERLVALVPEGWTVRAAEADLPRLSEWAVESRYPGEPEATPENARAALVAARAVVEAVDGDLRERGVR